MSKKSSKLNIDWGRRLSVWSVLFHQAIAARLGLNATDSRCLTLISLEGELTPGELSSLTGFTKGAITNILDHLETKGFVKRRHSTDDRRNWVIVPNTKKISRQVWPLFKPLGQEVRKLLSGYTKKEIAIIADFNIQTTEIFHQQVLRLNKQRKK